MSLWLSVDAATGRANGITGTPVAADPYIAGLRYQNVAPGALYCQSGFAAPTNSLMLGGMARDAQGVAYVLLEQTPPTPFYAGGVLVDALGTIYGTLTNPIANHVGGVPVDNAGRICFTPSGFGPVAIFDAPLTTTLVPVRAGDPTFTFTRATTAYVQDCDGILRNAVSGEARFQGARRVQNVILKSQNFTITANGWALQFGTATVTPNDALAPDGTLTASKIVFGTNSGNGSNISPDLSGLATFLHGRPIDNLAYRGSIYVKGTAGQTFNIWVRTSTSGSNETVAHVTLSGGWDRITTPGTSLNNLTSSDYPLLLIGTRNLDTAFGTADTVWVWGAQLEAVSGAANQAPGNYVSSGVLAAPYQGAGVDAVQYFGTLNGNSVAANVVTEAVGTAIPAATLLGYVAENQATNLCLQSQTFDAAPWTLTNTTIVANNIAAPDGSLTADKITDNATNAVHRIIQTVASMTTATTYTFSVYVKQGTLPWMCIHVNDGATNRWANFDLTNGVVGLTSGATLAIQALANGWYRIALTVTSTSNGGYVAMECLQTNSANPTGGTYIGTGQTMYIWGAQLEQGDASSYIPTTSASVTRNLDQLQYQMAGNLDGATATTYAECYFPTVAAGVAQVPLVHINGTQFQYYDGTTKKLGIWSGGGNFFTVAAARNVGALNKSAIAWSAATASACLNGGAVATGSFSAFPTGVLIAGGDSQHTVQGSIRNVRFYATRLADAALVTMTT